MFGRLAVKLTLFALKRADLSIADRGLLTTCILDRLAALPLRDIINVNEEGTLLVNGRSLSPEGKVALRESARAAVRNRALRLITDQVLFISVAMGVHTVKSADEMMFSRAAIWFGQHQDRLLTLLAQEDPERELAP